MANEKAFKQLAVNVFWCQELTSVEFSRTDAIQSYLQFSFDVFTTNGAYRHRGVNVSLTEHELIRQTSTTQQHHFREDCGTEALRTSEPSV